MVISLQKHCIIYQVLKASFNYCIPTNIYTQAIRFFSAKTYNWWQSIKKKINFKSHFRRQEFVQRIQFILMYLLEALQIKILEYFWQPMLAFDLESNNVCECKLTITLRMEEREKNCSTNDKDRKFTFRLQWRDESITSSYGFPNIW